MFVNAERGEVPLTVGNVNIVIAAEINRLAAVSTSLKCMSFAELYQRLMAVELAASLAAIQHLTVRGNAEAAVRALKLGDLPACKVAFTEALSHHLNDDEGKVDAAGEAAATSSKASPSENG